jgi:hypothetical protein
MLALVLSAALSLVSHSAAAPAHAARPSHTVNTTRTAANFPTTGIIVPGQTIGGIALGMTAAQVVAHWGANYKVCPGTSCGPDLTWLYVYPGGSAALGAAIKFSTPASTGTSTTSATTEAAAAAAAKVAAQKALAAQTAETRAATAARLAATKATAATVAAAKAVKAAGAKTAGAALKAAAKAATAKAAAAKAASVAAAAAVKAASATALAAKTAAAKATAAASAATSAASAAASGTVVAVFTLGSPTGWGMKGVIMYDPVSNVYNVFGNPATQNCVGYSALTVKIGDSTTSFYSSSGVIYGFALTAPSQSPCQ